MLDGRLIVQDLEKYKSIIDAFEPINSSDSFQKYFEAKSPFTISFICTADGSCKSFSFYIAKRYRWQTCLWFKYSYFTGDEVAEVSGGIREKIIEGYQKECWKITKTLDIVNIRELSIDRKKLKWDSVKPMWNFNDNVGKIFKYSIRNQDNGGYYIEVKFR